jgi:hypothetical protein
VVLLVLVAMLVVVLPRVSRRWAYQTGERD